MATLDDKILGEKLHYYCSSSEDEGEGEEEKESTCASQEPPPPKFIPEPELQEWEGYSCNTGPKGVLKDWQRYKQLETKKRESQEAERLSLMKKLSITCQTSSDQDKKKNRDQAIDDELDQMLSSNDPFLAQYMQKRMQEMLKGKNQHLQSQQFFGKLIELYTGAEFLEAVDKEKTQVTIICHIYCKDIPSCTRMNGCLSRLAEDFSYVKFCSIEASSAGMSKHFEKSGVPALLVYKKGSLLGNFVRVTDVLGEEFYANDVEVFLVDHGYLPDQTCVPEIVSKSIRCDATGESDSDLD